VAQLLQTRGVFAVISFAAESGPGGDPRHFYSGLPALSQPELSEVWYTSGPVEFGITDNCHWSKGEEMLFVGLWLDETPAESQQAAVAEGYRELLGFIRSSGYPEIVRSWNYLPHINTGEGDSEHYRQFCLGRQTAFTECGYGEGDYPAACALGNLAGKASIYLLAGKEPVKYLENPRQVSAYDYPRKYGPASPSFARASIAQWATGNQLYLSGTASIVGHHSRCVGDVEGQLRVTFENIDVLLAQGGQESGRADKLEMTMLKVYVRLQRDLEVIKAAVQQHFPDVPALYLQADICRQELLVEIDGICELPAIEASVQAPLFTAHE
jgi:chorismate lyase/3-hydroxybenzoate synthase